jgi:AP-3 complex subunit delta-1
VKYLGLFALNNIMKIQPKAASEHRDIVVNCLDDNDVTIRMRALDLLEGMANKRNVVEIVKKLLNQIERCEPDTYRDHIVEKIINICSKDSYALVTDFEWYISVLMELAHLQGMFSF